jgi:hypothetical protein
MINLKEYQKPANMRVFDYGSNFLLAHKRKLQRKCATQAKFKNKLSVCSLKFLKRQAP